MKLQKVKMLKSRGSLDPTEGRERRFLMPIWDSFLATIKNVEMFLTFCSNINPNYSVPLLELHHIGHE